MYIPTDSVFLQQKKQLFKQPRHRLQNVNTSIHFLHTNEAILLLLY